MASKPEPRVFLDSNVIFSGLYSPLGAPGIILERFVTGSLSVVVSQQVLEEVIRTVKEKLPDVLPVLSDLLVNAPPEVVADPKLLDIQPWTKKLQLGDAAILAAAVAAQPDYFVTGDRHFTNNKSLDRESGLQIVTPAQFLRLLDRAEIE